MANTTFPTVAEQMAISEMREVYSETIGGFENTKLDYPEGSEEYTEADNFLKQPTEKIAEYICNETFKSLRSSEKNMKFAGKAFIMERIMRKLTKDGYNN